MRRIPAAVVCGGLVLVVAGAGVAEPITGAVGRALCESYVADFGGTHINFDSFAVGTQLDTELQTSHGVTFWTTTDTSGNPLGTPHNVRVSSASPSSAPNCIVGTPSPGAGDDGRPYYEIRFDTPQRWAGVSRTWSSWNANCRTRFYAASGAVLANLNVHPERWAGYRCMSEDTNDWISLIECWSASLETGYTDDLMFGMGPDLVGTEIWTHAHDAGDADSPYDIAIDSLGNILTAGYTVPIGQTIRSAYLYSIVPGSNDPSWSVTRKLPATTTRNAEFHGIVIDSADNAIVCGYMGGDSAPYSQGFVAKYMPDGSNDWEDIFYDAPNGDTEAQAFGLDMDSSGNTYVAMYMANPGHPAGEWIAIKYTPDGQRTLLDGTHYEPATTYALRNIPFGIAVDDAGHLCMVGRKGNTGQNRVDWHVRFFNSYSNFVWEHTFGAPEYGQHGYAFDVDLDTNGNPVVAGYMNHTGGARGWVIKYDQATGDPVWSNRYDRSSSGEYLWDLQVDEDGSVLVAGRCDGANMYGVLLRLDGEDGSLLQEQIWNTQDNYMRALDNRGGKIALAQGVSNDMGIVLLQADFTAPDLTLLGDNPLEWGLNIPFVDPGYTATDDVDGDITGNVVVTGVLDVTTAGTYTLHYNVSDSSGNAADPTQRTVNVSAATPDAPAALAPTGTVTDTVRPVFEWTDVSAPWYKLSITRNGNAYYTHWFQTTTWTPTWDFAQGNYAWKVQAWNQYGLGPWSGEETFQLPLMVPAATTLLGPSGELTANPPTFEWEAVQHATRYRLYIQKDGGFYDARWINLETDYTPASALPDGNYKWWVRTDGLHGSGPWSDAMSFHCGVPLLPGMSEPLSPTGMVCTAEPDFEWTYVGNASRYRIVITKDGSAYADVWMEYEDGGCNLAREELGKPFGPGDYRWWVQTASPMGNGPWSDPADFTVDLAAPGQPVCSEPVGHAFQHSENPTWYEWTGDPEATWARLLVKLGATTVHDRWYRLYGDHADAFGYGQTVKACFAADVNYRHGVYTWSVAEWQPGYPAQWSAAATFEIQDCAAAPPEIQDVTVDGEFQPLEGQGHITCPRPLVWWNGEPDVKWYHVQVRRPNGSVQIEEWVMGWRDWFCSTDLPPNNYTVRVRGWNRLGMGVWSPDIACTVDYSAPSMLSNVSLAYVGNKAMVSADIEPDTYWYHVEMRRNGAAYLNRWFNLQSSDKPNEDLIDDDRFCWLVPDSLPEGSYDMRINSWNGQGGGTWSAWQNITVDPLTKPELYAPTGVVATYQPEFRWEDLPTVDAYRILLKRGTVTYVDEILEVSDEFIIYTDEEEDNSFAEVGVAQGWHGNDAFWTVPLAFEFPFFRTSYTQLFVNVNGAIVFGEGMDEDWWDIDFPGVPAIAALWGSLRTDIGDSDIFVATDATSATIRWKARYENDTDEQANVSVTLSDDGSIVLKYGSGNVYGGAVGVSAGDYLRYLQDLPGTMADSDDLVFTLRDNLGGVLPWQLPEGDYRWWIQAIRANGADTVWSDAAEFTIDVP